MTDYIAKLTLDPRGLWLQKSHFVPSSINPTIDGCNNGPVEWVGGFVQQ